MSEDKITFQLPLSNIESVTDDKNSSIHPNHIADAKIVGRITQEIGTGDDAKHSIIWTTIRWCFIIATGISTILFIFLGIAYFNKNINEINELKKFILAMWSVFTPIITLSLGYAFGKDYK